jgi:hypothetical protein
VGNAILRGGKVNYPEPPFKVGDKICKPKGYAFDGTVVSIFKTLTGNARVVAELTTANGEGMLHIFSENQLALRHE